MPTVRQRWRNFLGQKQPPARPDTRVRPELMKPEAVLSWQEAIASRATSPKDRFFVFCHIPKTAGITLAMILSKNYEPSTLVHVPADEQQLAQELKNTKVLRGRINAIAGHFYLNSELYDLVPSRYVHFTMLRDPIERVISFYYYIRNEPAHRLHEQAKKMALGDFLRAGQLGELNDGQTRRLSGMRYRYGQSPPEAVDVAKQNLHDRFTFFGVTEKFDETLVVLRAMLSWNSPFYANQNVTRDRPRIDEIASTDREAIVEYNQQDLALYAYAEEVFEQRIRRLEPRLTAEVQALRSANATFHRHQSAFQSRLRELDRLYPWPANPG